MYDHQTDSLWHNLTGEPVVGKLAHSGIQLKTLPVVITSWQQWHQKHPETLVLDINTGFDRDYGPGKAYADYFASPDTMFPVSPRDPRHQAKSYVFALEVHGQPKAYPLAILSRERLINDTLGDTNVVLVAGMDHRTVRAYASGTYSFADDGESGVVREVKTQAKWHVKEDALIHATTGERLARLGGHVSYWFGWYAFYPYAPVYGQTGNRD
jgi:hypothetical protein